MNSLKDLKAALTVGTTVLVTEHHFPELNGERTVVKAQTQRVCLSLPAGHQRADRVPGSWLTLPKRSECTFHGDTVHIHPDPAAGVSLRMTIPGS